ncbi:MAG: NAD(P)/FAD-dependent oxidoreductase [Clostridia bacterium]|nr:NAD(P)/FAD-dependent oxidoreductase [Clostridia bacterium]MCL6522313.1 NAD(P)/FAD-dependent oxidoreductase [Bacillota bacterium]
MAQRVVFLGAGDGGMMAANRLARMMREELDRGELEILLIGDSDRHLYQPGLLYVALNQAEPQQFFRPQTRLLMTGVQLLVDPAVRISPEQRTVECASGRRVEYDFLVIATGSHPDLDAIPGLRQGGYSFYTLPEALRLRKALQEFQGGRVLMAIGVPHKCPVAPLEFMFILDDYLRRTGLREKSELVYTYPIARLHSLQPVAEWTEKVFAERNIRGETFFNVESVDPDAHKVSTLEGEEVEYDLLVAIPPHKGAQVIRDSGLGDADGWLPTDPRTLRMKGQERIYVLGDATDLPISKAGSTAHYESEVVARNLVHELRGEPPVTLYDGKVFCFIEAGLEEATYVSFDYRNPPRPASPAAMIHWFKLAYNEMYWLSLRGLL